LVGWFADVAAPVGRETVPEMFVMFHVPDWTALTENAVLSLAIVTR
jgi:hypothetical protein